MLNRWETESGKKICAVDIDGVLNYYPDPWVAFINERLRSKYRDLNEAKYRIPYQEYRDLKYEYRESGIKATLPVREGASEFLNTLKERGFSIVIITSRPFETHHSLFKQTVDWLENGDLPYDDLIASSQKYVEVLLKVPRLNFLIDDHRFYANSVASWGYNAVLLNNQYNQGDTELKVVRVNTLREVLDLDFAK